jgi:hypothetical protein
MRSAGSEEAREGAGAVGTAALAAVELCSDGERRENSGGVGVHGGGAAVGRGCCHGKKKNMPWGTSSKGRPWRKSCCGCYFVGKRGGAGA